MKKTIPKARSCCGNLLTCKGKGNPKDLSSQGHSHEREAKRVWAVNHHQN